jgi:hypothetical protein
MRNRIRFSWATLSLLLTLAALTPSEGKATDQYPCNANHIAVLINPEYPEDYRCKPQCCPFNGDLVCCWTQ